MDVSWLDLYARRLALERAVAVRRLLTCFLGAARTVSVAREPRPLEPDTGPALRFLLRFADVDDGDVLRVRRLVRFVAVDLSPDFFRISLIALLTMPEISSSTMPAMPIPMNAKSPTLPFNEHYPARWSSPCYSTKSLP